MSSIAPAHVCNTVLPEKSRQRRSYLIKYSVGGDLTETRVRIHGKLKAMVNCLRPGNVLSVLKQQ